MRATLVALIGLVVCECRGAPAKPEGLAAEPVPTTSVRAPDAGPSDDPTQALLYQGMPRLSVVLDDPRLSEVRERELTRDWEGASRAMDAALASMPIDAPRRPSWTYVAGRLHLAAGDSVEATAAFEQFVSSVRDTDPARALRPYAAFHEAQTLVHLGRYDEALARARMSEEVAAHDEVELVVADAYVGKGDRAAAVPIWRSLLAANPRGLRWADTSLQLATALLDGVEGAPVLHAQEALDLATGVLVDAPSAAEKLDVAGLRARASLFLSRGVAPELTPEERAEQAQAWLDAAQPKKATEAADALLKSLRGDKHREAACKVAIVRAQAKPHGKWEEAADAWGVAINRCDAQDALVTALYYGAKASASARRLPEAVERFHRVEKLFPTHRLADDACLRAALVECDSGNETRGLAALASLPDTYPEGDMAGEALFRVALAKLVKRDLPGAQAALDRMLAAGLDGGRGTAGRGAYFRARVAQLAGDLDDARRRYAEVLARQPLGYYMLLAHARLRALNPEQARSVIEEGVAREQGMQFLTKEHPELASPSFDRFARLLEVGEFDSARREAHAGGLVADGVDPELLWTVAWSYDRAGAPDLGHSFTRSRLVDFREHWPAGRWRLAWEVAYPRVWQSLVGRESEAVHVPLPLTWAIMREESAFNPDAHSVADAIGLMQLIVPTARVTARGTAFPWDDESLRRPEVSIALGTRLLSSLRASFPANPALAIAAYNGGSRAVRRWLDERGGDDFDVFVERIPFEETRAYLKRVLSSQAAYAYLYAPGGLDEVLALIP